MLTKQQLTDFELSLAEKYDQGHYPYLVHFCGGNEDQLIELFREVSPDDWVFSTHRSHYHYLLHGGSPDYLESLVARGKSMFVFDRARRFYTSSILAATPAIAAGVAWAIKRLGLDRHVWCFVGDGAADEGHFYEAARYVDGHDLPCTFILEDNNRSVSASRKERWGQTGWRKPRFDCVRRYHYQCAWPHGGTGRPGSGKNGWIEFKAEPILENPLKRQGFTCDYRQVNCSPGTKYIEAVTEAMNALAVNGYVFVGYNVRHGSAYGTLKDVPEDQRLETPVAENLMAGLAMGMSLEGIRPVLFFERHDFVWNALDALVNQMDKVPTISEGQFDFPVIIRAVAGGVKPFYAGLTHTSDYTWLFRQLFTFPVCLPESPAEVLATYEGTRKLSGPVLISELKDWHGRTSQ